MTITIVSGIGTGPTELSAFDSALNDAGVANYNLLRLSSVIPPASQLVEVEKAENLPGQWGDKLYVVMAENRSSTRGEEIWAGIGWVQNSTDGSGLFVEHEGESEAAVRSDIRNSLEQLMKTRGMEQLEISMVVKGAKVKDDPTCALVIAVYEASGWQSNSDNMGDK